MRFRGWWLGAAMIPRLAWADPCDDEMIRVYAAGGWSPAQIREVCPSFGAPPAAPAAKVKRETLTLSPIGPRCPQADGAEPPFRYRGEDGEGGRDYLRVRHADVALELALKHDTKMVHLLGEYHATTTEGGAFDVEDKWVQTLYTAPTGWLIDAIESPMSGRVAYADEGNGGSSPVEKVSPELGLIQKTAIRAVDVVPNSCNMDGEEHPSVAATLNPVIVVLRAE